MHDAPPVTFAAAHAAARGRWPELLAALGIDPQALTPTHKGCPGCGGRDRFRFDDQDGRGTWYCSGAGNDTAGDGFDLLCHVHGWTRAEALAAVADYLGLTAGAAAPPPVRPASRAEEDRDTVRAADHRRILAAWSAAKPAPGDHPYLVRKGVSGLPLIPEHLRINRAGDLLVPLHGPAGELLAFQRIPADPAAPKRFPRGSRTAGARFALPCEDPAAPIAIVEGFATGCSVALATGWRVVVAFSAGNLARVAADLRAQSPAAALYVAGDNDVKPDSDTNPGRAAALKAARVAAALPLLPPVPGDWNDYHSEHGLDALRTALQVAVAAKEEISKNNETSFESFESIRHKGSGPSHVLRTSFAVFEDALLEETERGPRRLIESAAAEIIADGLRDRLAYDAEAGSWLLWSDTHWEPLNVAAAAEKLIADAVATGTGRLGFRLSYLNGITGVIQRRDLLPPPPWPRAVVPFLNGLLDLTDQTLRDATPRDALDWVLPHTFDPAATCPNIKAWLSFAVEDDPETVELLRAWMAALVRGIPLQKFMVLIGRGGSGKGTFERLLIALVGLRNVAVTNLNDLENNRFEAAKLYGRRLALVSEAGRHGGSLNMLKKITGGDHVPIEKKHVQQHGSFVFTGLVLMSTNEQIQSTDATSGLERRRLMVRFPRTATPEMREAWRRRGGEEGVLHAEIPGLVNWLLEMPEAEIRRRIEAPPERVVSDNLLGMAAGNSVADWLMDCCIPGVVDPLDPDGRFVTQIGIKEDDRESGVMVYRNASTRLFPNYLTWCDQSARRPVSLNKFTATLLDIAETLGHRLIAKHHPRTRAMCVYGIRLRTLGDARHDWSTAARHRAKDLRDGEGPREGLEAAPRLDAKDPKDLSQTLDKFSRVQLQSADEVRL